MKPFSLFFFAMLAARAVVAQDVTLTPTDNGLRVDVGGQVFTEYVTKGAQRPYMYPIIGPSGANLARPYPMEKGGAEDHPHHRSFWFTHGGINGVDFWGNGEKNGTQKHVAFDKIESSGNKGSFVARTSWVLADGTEVLTDERVIRIEALPEGGKQVDFTVAMSPSSSEVTFNDTKEGSFALRLGPTLSIKENKDAHIVTSEGAMDKKAWGTRAKWTTFYGPDAKGEPVSVTVFDHPQNLRHPTWWHARDYGLFAANPFGIHDFEKSEDKTKGDHVVAKGQTFTQRYRVLVQKGEPDQARLAEVFQSFSQTK